MYITTVFVRLIVVLSYDWSYGRHMTNRPTNFEVIYWLYVSYDQTMSNDSTAVPLCYPHGYAVCMVGIVALYGCYHG